MNSRHIGAIGLILAVALLGAARASAQEQYGASRVGRLTATFLPDSASRLRAADEPPPAPLTVTFVVHASEAQAGSPRPVAFEYSDKYRLRAKIHRYASFATLPLFAAEAVVGQSLYNNPTGGKKAAHLALAAGMGGLFGLNTVTGLWNLVEARKDPNGRVRRLVHGLLLLAADAGFFGAALTGPHGDDDGRRFRTSSSSSRSLHRALAMSSIGLTTAGYLIMLIK